MKACAIVFWISFWAFSSSQAADHPKQGLKPGLHQLMSDYSNAVKRLPEDALKLPPYPGARSLKIRTRFGKARSMTSEVMQGQHHEGWATRDPEAKVQAFYESRLTRAGYRKILDLPLGKNGRSWSYASQRQVVQIDFYTGSATYQPYLERGQTAPRGTNGIFIYEKQY